MARPRTESENGKTVSIYLQPSEIVYLLTLQPTITAAIRRLINERKEATHHG